MSDLGDKIIKKCDWLPTSTDSASIDSTNHGSKCWGKCICTFTDIFLPLFPNQYSIIGIYIVQGVMRDPRMIPAYRRIAPVI